MSANLTNISYGNDTSIFDSGPPGRRPIGGMHFPSASVDSAGLSSYVDMNMFTGSMSKRPRLGTELPPIIVTTYNMKPWIGGKNHHLHVTDGDIVYAHNSITDRTRNLRKPVPHEQPILKTILNHPQLVDVMRREWNAATIAMHDIMSKKYGSALKVNVGTQIVNKLANHFNLQDDDNNISNIEGRIDESIAESQARRVLSKWTSTLAQNASRVPLIDVDELEMYTHTRKGAVNVNPMREHFYMDFANDLTRHRQDEMNRDILRIAHHLEQEDANLDAAGVGNGDKDGYALQRVMNKFGMEMAESYHLVLEGFVQSDGQSKRGAALLYDFDRIWSENLTYLSPALVYENWDFVGVVTGKPNMAYGGELNLIGSSGPYKSIAVTAYGYVNTTNIIQQHLYAGEQVSVNIMKHFDQQSKQFTFPELAFTVDQSRSRSKYGPNSIPMSHETYMDSLTGQVGTRTIDTTDNSWYIGSVQHMEPNDHSGADPATCLASQGLTGYADSLESAYEARTKLKDVVLQVRQH